MVEQLDYELQIVVRDLEFDRVRVHRRLPWVVKDSAGCGLPRAAAGWRANRCRRCNVTAALLRTRKGEHLAGHVAGMAVPAAFGVNRDELVDPSEIALDAAHAHPGIARDAFKTERPTDD